MSGLRPVLVALGWGFVGALLSSLIASGTTAIYPEIMGCEAGCAVAAAGWPFAYLVDYPGISVVGSVSLTGPATGEDKLIWPAFLATWALWSLAAFAITLVLRRLRRS